MPELVDTERYGVAYRPATLKALVYPTAMTLLRRSHQERSRMSKGTVYLLTVAALILILLTACLGGDARSPDDPTVVWKYDTGALDESELLIVSPTVVESVVYAGSYDGKVYALDARTGEPLWSFETKSDPDVPPIVAEGVVHVVDLEAHYALDAATGRGLWRSEAHYFTEDGTIAFMVTEAADGLGLGAIDGITGEHKWVAHVPRSSSIPLRFPPTAAGQNIFISDDSRVHALDATSGELEWSLDTTDIVDTPPTTSNGVVFLRSYSTAYALDESTGEQLWSYEAHHAGTGTLPVVVDGTWYLDDWSLRALDAATGQLLWSFAVDDEKADQMEASSTPLEVAEGMVFVQTLFTYEPAKNAFHALDAGTGDEIWSLGSDWDLSSVLVVDGVLYANSLSGYLHALDVRTGELIWSVEIGYHWWNRPFAVSEGMVYVGYVPETRMDGKENTSSGIYAFPVPSIK